MANLLTGGNVVETPFVTVTIGNTVLGVYKNSLKDGKTVAKVNAPNYIRSLTINKINGAINQYTLELIYGVTQFTDPNYIEKILSSASQDRRIVFSYGDFNEPSFIFKQEEALITNVQNSINFASSQMTYRIQAISTGVLSKALVRSWPARRTKPSQLIREIVTNNAYGLTDIFVGMQKANIITEKHLIATDDEVVNLEAKQNMSTFDYLLYLTSCMVSIGDSSAVYILTVHDDNEAPMNGCYFTVTKVSNLFARHHNPNAFEVTVGYPTDEFVIDFSVNTNDSWRLLYDYSKSTIQSNNTYLIDNDGNIVPYNTNRFIQNVRKGIVEQEANAWWKSVTEFPIKATLTIKGLLRPAQLMQYLKINSYFYGQKYIASGLYIITKQTDTINQSGYRTQLELQRISGDDDIPYTDFTTGLASNGISYQ